MNLHGILSYRVRLAFFSRFGPWEFPNRTRWRLQGRTPGEFWGMGVRGFYQSRTFLMRAPDEEPYTKPHPADEVATAKRLGDLYKADAVSVL